jgi:hypothetical protein
MRCKVCERHSGTHQSVLLRVLGGTNELGKSLIESQGIGIRHCGNSSQMEPFRLQIPIEEGINDIPLETLANEPIVSAFQATMGH